MVGDELSVSLSGRTVLVTRAVDDAQRMAQLVEALGGKTIVLPLIETRLLDNPSLQTAVHSYSSFDAVAVTSANAVRAWFAAGGSAGRDAVVSSPQPVWYAVGSQTAQVLANHGICAIVPDGCKNGGDLARFLATQALSRASPARQLLYLRGQLATPEMARQAAAAGWSVHECVCYETGPAPWLNQQWQDFLSSSAPRAILLFSPSAVRTLASHAGIGCKADRWLQGTVIVCVGWTTARACEMAGLPVHAVADQPDREHLLMAAAQAMEAVQRSDGTPTTRDEEEST